MRSASDGISGAPVFGLLQLPGRIEAAFDWWQVRLDGVATGIVRVDGWRYFAETGTDAWINPELYRNSGAVRDGLLPTIDADIISGSWLRLYLPYRPRRHNPLLETRCTTPPTERPSKGLFNHEAVSSPE